MKLPWTKRAEAAEDRVRAAEEQHRQVERQEEEARTQVRRARVHQELNGWNDIARSLIVGDR